MHWRTNRSIAIKHLSGLPWPVWSELLMDERSALWDVVFGLPDRQLLRDIHRRRSGLLGPCKGTVEHWLRSMTEGTQ